jgi:hypothetical protein
VTIITFWDVTPCEVVETLGIYCSHIVTQCLIIIMQSIQFWYKHTMHLHMLFVSSYCGYHQVQRAITVTLLPIQCTSQHLLVLTHWKCVVQLRS